MIYTSYFANLSKIDKAKFKPISIARFLPKYLKIPEYTKLAPTRQLFSAYKDGRISTIQYEQIFVRDVLSKLMPSVVAEELRKTSFGKIPVLLCYERPESFCHRHIVRSWLSLSGESSEELKI